MNDIHRDLCFMCSLYDEHLTYQLPHYVGFKIWNQNEIGFLSVYHQIHINSRLYVFFLCMYIYIFFY